jgi:CO/xanthine dehydrogenase Mo-binding subunit
MSARGLSRRAFGKAAAGIVVTFALAPRLALSQEAKKLPGSLQANRMLDGWLRIDPDGTVTVFTGKVEIGQGTVTALAQIAAEELDVALARVRMVSGDTGQTPDEGVTSGSQSMEMGGTALRYAAAEARAILLERAAAKLGTPPEKLAVADGAVSAPGGATTTYWEIAGEGMFRKEASAAVPPKPVSSHKLVGKPVPRLDIPAKVTGEAIYVQDVRLPGMLFGRVVRPPSYRAELLDIDEDAARRLPGIVAVVRDGRFLGLLAEREEQAVAARDRLAEATRWREPADLPDASALAAYLTAAPAKTDAISEKSTPGAEAAKRLQARYVRPYQAHASIGPSCAVAQLADGKLTVWSHTQGVFPLRRDLAKVMRLPESQIRVIHAQGSGCYGHNGADDVALDAALLARAANGRPVKLQWMRDDEFQWEPYGAAMVMDVRGGLSADGSIVDWEYQLWSNTHSTRPGSRGGSGLLAGWHLAEPVNPPPPAGLPQPAGGGDRNAIPLYDFARQKVVHHFLPEMPIRVSALRTLGAYANVFATESFMDELAAAAGADPVDFRLKHLKDERARAVIKTAAERAGWQPGAKGSGTRGRGIGFAKYKNLSAYVAVVADVEVDRRSGAIRIEKAWAACDAGQVINPDGLENQIEGGIIQSASWTLKEAVKFDRSRVLSRDWESYPILTFPEVPPVETILLDRPEEKPLGAGEGSQGPAAAAIANALAHATGARIRELPLAPERVKAALG